MAQINYTQTGKVLKRFFEMMKNQSFGDDRKAALLDSLIKNKSLDDGTSENIKKTENTVEFFKQIKEMIKKYPIALQAIHEWIETLPKNTQKNVKKGKEPDIGKLQNLGYTVTWDQNSGSSIFDVLLKSDKISKERFLNAEELKENMRTALLEMDLKSLRWIGCPDLSDFNKQRRVIMKGHPLVLHIASTKFNLIIHVICLMTMEEVLFFPDKHVQDCQHAYIARLQKDKYVQIRPMQDSELAQQRMNVLDLSEIENLIKRVDELTGENNNLQHVIESQRKTIESLQSKVKELGRDLETAKKEKVLSELVVESLQEKYTKLREEFHKYMSKMEKEVQENKQKMEQKDIEYKQKMEQMKTEHKQEIEQIKTKIHEDNKIVEGRLIALELILQKERANEKSEVPLSGENIPKPMPRQINKKNVDRGLNGLRGDTKKERVEETLETSSSSSLPLLHHENNARLDCGLNANVTDKSKTRRWGSFHMPLRENNTSIWKRWDMEKPQSPTLGRNSPNRIPRSRQSLQFEIKAIKSNE